MCPGGVAAPSGLFFVFGGWMDAAGLVVGCIAAPRQVTNGFQATLRLPTSPRTPLPTLLQAPLKLPPSLKLRWTSRPIKRLRRTSRSDRRRDERAACNNMIYPDFAFSVILNLIQNLVFKSINRKG